MREKVRVDFYYWNCGSGFSHIKTIDYSSIFIDAKKYVDNIDVDYFIDIPYDAIMVRTVDNENDYVLSEYWWNLKN